MGWSAHTTAAVNRNWGRVTAPMPLASANQAWKSATVNPGSSIGFTTTCDSIGPTMLTMMNATSGGRTLEVGAGGGGSATRTDNPGKRGHC